MVRLGGCCARGVLVVVGQTLYVGFLFVFVRVCLMCSVMYLAPSDVSRYPVLSRCVSGSLWSVISMQLKFSVMNLLICCLCVFTVWLESSSLYGSSCEMCARYVCADAFCSVSLGFQSEPILCHV